MRHRPGRYPSLALTYPKRESLCGGRRMRLNQLGQQFSGDQTKQHSDDKQQPPRLRGELRRTDGP